jgi:hypothetical protein
LQEPGAASRQYGQYTDAEDEPAAAGFRSGEGYLDVEVDRDGQYYPDSSTGQGRGWQQDNSSQEQTGGTGPRSTGESNTERWSVAADTTSMDDWD